ncbi:polyphosphate:AMP phosphotransferase [Zwartia vadi]|uniref:polyphosphate:AMP phosphotransferase n=1 Tax=Zwartia vadi TaxID=3058168 RepID=UPI00338D6D35
MSSMFDEAERDPKLTDDEFARFEEPLRIQLLNEQYRHLKLKDRALVIVVAGIDGAGKGETINLLNEWLDPRHVRTVAFAEPTPEEKAYPPFRRLWLGLPPKGSVGIMFGAGYLPLFKEVGKKNPYSDFIESMISDVRNFENTLVANDVQVIKLWFHLSRDAQRTRTAQLLSNPSTAWQVGKNDKNVFKHFDRVRQIGQRIIEATDSAHAPWIIIPSADKNVRTLRTAQAVLDAFKVRHLKVPPPHDPAASPKPIKTHHRLLRLDYEASVDKELYEQELTHWQNRLAIAVRGKDFKKQSLVLVFEGQDAAGKGGAIRRVTHALDARQYRTVSVAAPRPFEMDRPYLWRFWRSVPRRGRITIFDRSWYGRVLVERIEGYATRPAWQRAYREINQFEHQLVKRGAVVLKFWLAITPEEQLKRFRAREHSPYKNFKITPEDWRNRRQWASYAKAAEEMFAKTDTPHASWHVISANDKRYARLEVIRRITQALEKSSKT